MVDTSDEWIRDRTGIEQRHIAATGEYTVDLAEAASRQAIEAAGISTNDIDLIIVATTTSRSNFSQHRVSVAKSVGYSWLSGI